MSTAANRPVVDGLPVQVLLAVEEDIPLLLGHIEESPSFSVDPSFLVPGPDGPGLVGLGVRKLILRRVVRDTLAFQQRLLAFN